ncbi:MAG TPA: hypothetical protein VG309_03340 [Rhizomicrobium sp.]|jgi:hypothetical protein|nr:hypothetical protein [Rhizomicrobium sp.]
MTKQSRGRQERLAAALRENLKRRKVRDRARETGSGETAKPSVSTSAPRPNKDKNGT